jgi:hypothetical protein
MDELKRLIAAQGQQLEALAKEQKATRSEIAGIISAQQQCNQMLAHIHQAWADLHAEGVLRKPPTAELRAVDGEGG